MPTPSFFAFDSNEELPLSGAQVLDLISVLPPTISSRLCKLTNAVLVAQAPFSDALSELAAYLAGLDDAKSLPFEQQIQLKAYVMVG